MSKLEGWGHFANIGALTSGLVSESHFISAAKRFKTWKLKAGNFFMILRNETYSCTNPIITRKRLNLQIDSETRNSRDKFLPNKQKIQPSEKNKAGNIAWH